MSEPLTTEETAALLAAFGGGFVGVRDRAWCAVLYGCGVRSNECRMLDLVDLDLERWTVRVRFPKNLSRGAKPRTIGVKTSSRIFLEQWLAIRGVREGPLFITGAFKRVDTSQIRRALPKVAKRAGIARHAHPHALRHTFAHELDREKVSMRLIQLALGHADMGTTAIYLSGLGDQEVIEATGER